MKSGGQCSVCLVKVHDILQIPQRNGIHSISEQNKSQFSNITHQRPNQAFQHKIWEKYLQILDSALSTTMCGHQVATYMRHSTWTSWPFPYLSVYREIGNISGLNVGFTVWMQRWNKGALCLDGLSHVIGSSWCDRWLKKELQPPVSPSKGTSSRSVQQNICIPFICA